MGEKGATKKMWLRLEKYYREQVISGLLVHIDPWLFSMAVKKR
jgi:hypothetical protein